jgi:hypothetical protein
MENTSRRAANKGLVRLQVLQDSALGSKPMAWGTRFALHQRGDAVIRLIMRSRTLLPFEYTLTELMTELGVSSAHRKKFAEWCRPTYPNPIPHTYDPTGHILVHGWAFRDWIRTQLAYRRRQRTRLPPGHLWCSGCNRPQRPHNPKFDEVNGRRRMLAFCAEGHTMSQFVSRGAK